MTGRPVAVVGGGLMGAGIAQMFAAGGRSVCVYEPANAVCRTVVARIPENLGEIGGDPAAAELVEVTNDPARAVRGACFVTEAAPEKLAVKQAIFADLERYASEDAILASNSSAMRTAGRSRPRASRPYRAPGRSVQKHRAGSPASARPSSAAARNPRNNLDPTTHTTGRMTTRTLNNLIGHRDPSTKGPSIAAIGDAPNGPGHHHWRGK